VTPLPTAPSASWLRRAPVGRAAAAITIAIAALAIIATVLAGHRHAAAIILACTLTTATAAVIAFVHILAASLAQRPDTLPDSAGIWESDQEVDDFIRDTYAARSGAAACGLTLAAYQAGARTTARYPHHGLTGLYYTALGLAGEAGEIANKVKKIMRDEGETLPDHARTAIADELGDALWYAAALAHELGVPLEAIAARNLAKLRDRKQRGTITGSGDRR
jgi:NTP pyrophosphatase (non-canonical NTP hydrolase)